ncbi:MAG: PilZ domain-containing protein [Deltaproteobacteria bacterium]|nr:PilZ domain-containing protein [Deltaproteobacteria bacterium]
MDFSFLYSTRIENTYDDDQTRILACFRELLKQGKTRVSLINYYKGLPISYPATIAVVDRDVLDLDIHPQQAVAINKDRYAFIRCPAFSHVVGAHVHYVNVRKQAATLKGFFFAELMAERRNAIRLELDPPTEAVFELQGESLQGRLVDLSMSGAAVRFEQPPSFEDGFETMLQFMLPNIIQNTLAKVKAPARHLGTTELDGAYLLKFSIAPDKALEQQISHYIFQRQVEIIRELKEMSA